MLLQNRIPVLANIPSNKNWVTGSGIKNPNSGPIICVHIFHFEVFKECAPFSVMMPSPDPRTDICEDKHDTRNKHDGFEHTHCRQRSTNRAEPDLRQAPTRFIFMISGVRPAMTPASLLGISVINYSICAAKNCRSRSSNGFLHLGDEMSLAKAVLFCSTVLGLNLVFDQSQFAMQ